MSEHLRHLSRHARDPGHLHAERGAADAHGGRRVLPADAPRSWPTRTTQFTREFGLVAGRRLLRHDARAPAPGRRGGAAAAPVQPRRPRPEPGVASLYQHVPFRQDTSYLSIGERTNANGSKAFREAMLEPRWDDCVEIARDQTRDGAHLLDVCVDYVGRDGVDDMKRGRQPARHLEHAAARARLHRAGGHRGRAGAARRPRRDQLGELRGRRRARRRGSRAIMRIVREHGAAVVALTIDEEGQARTRDQKVAVASRLIDALTGEWGMRVEDIIVDTLTFPIATGQEETRRDGARDDRGDPRDQAALPRGADDARPVEHLLRPQARPPGMVLNSVFLHECVKAGLDSAIVHAAKIVPMDRIPRGAARRRARPDLRPARAGDREARATTRCALPRAVRGRRRRVAEGLPGRRAGRAAAGGAAGPAHHRRRAQGARGRPAGGPRQGPQRARHHQRPPARRACGPSASCSAGARCSCRSCCSPPR